MLDNGVISCRPCVFFSAALLHTRVRFTVVTSCLRGLWSVWTANKNMSGDANEGWTESPRGRWTKLAWGAWGRGGGKEENDDTFVELGARTVTV